MSEKRQVEIHLIAVALVLFVGAVIVAWIVHELHSMEYCTIERTELASLVKCARFFPQ